MIESAKKELQEKFVGIIDRHQGLLYKVAHAYCTDPEEQKDLVQEIIFQLWKSFRKYDEKYRISTWMYRIALNVAISHLRRHKLRERHHAPIDVQLVQVSEEDREDTGEEIRLLRQFIQEQNKLDKGLLLLYLDGNSHAETAEVLGISASNAGTRLGRLKQKLKQYLIKNME